MESNKYSYGFQFLVLIALAVICGIVFFLLSALIVIPVYGMQDLLTDGITGSLSNPTTIAALKIMQLFNTVGLFIVPPFIFSRWLKSKPSTQLMLTPIINPLNYLLVPLLMIAAMPVINWMAELNSNMQLPEFLSGVEHWMKAKEKEAAMLTEAFLKMNNLGDLAYNLFLVAIIPAIGEELLFRGAIQNILSKWFKSTHWGIWIAAILFSAMHGQFYGFFPRMILGAVFGYMLVWSGSLWVPILAHFVNNGVAVVIAYFVGTETLSKDIETIGSTTESIILTAVCLVVCGGLLWLIKHKNSANEISM